jgi:hypothetical protein
MARRRSLAQWAPLLVALALLAAYWPSLGGGFIWDDDAHIVNNAQLRDLAGLLRIWLQDRSCWTHELQLTPFSTKPSYWENPPACVPSRERLASGLAGRVGARGAV